MENPTMNNNETKTAPFISPALLSNSIPLASKKPVSANPKNAKNGRLITNPNDELHNDRECSILISSPVSLLILSAYGSGKS